VKIATLACFLGRCAFARVSLTLDDTGYAAQGLACFSQLRICANVM